MYISLLLFYHSTHNKIDLNSIYLKHLVDTYEGFSTRSKRLIVFLVFYYFFPEHILVKHFGKTVRGSKNHVYILLKNLLADEK